MRVAILTETYSKKMGYAENSLSKALAALGADVHVISPRLAPYHSMPAFAQTYGGFADMPTTETSEHIDGYTVHYLPHTKPLGYVRVKGLLEKLRSLKPQVVQTFAAISWIPLDAAVGSARLNYKLFTGSHTTASVFPLARTENHLWEPKYLKCLLTRSVPGRFISLFTEACYGATTDCSDVAVRFFGVQQKKIRTCPLGVDTDLFYPLSDTALRAQRDELRRNLGFQQDEIVCIFTGRFSDDKNPLLLAQAIDSLAAQGLPYRGLFIGNGLQRDAIEQCRASITKEFVPFSELGQYFRAADIGVWPTQESVSMMDAAACGLPIVVNDTLIAVERVEGNGLTYKLNNLDDLIRSLLELRDAGLRDRLGSRGAEKMAGQFSWRAIARSRLRDYEAALNGNSDSCDDLSRREQQSISEVVLARAEEHDA